jgi:hypothetical protein
MRRYDYRGVSRGSLREERVLALSQNRSCSTPPQAIDPASPQIKAISDTILMVRDRSGREGLVAAETLPIDWALASRGTQGSTIQG